MMLTLYTFPPSPNARKVHAVVNYLGLKPEIKIVHLGEGKHRSPEFLAINPNGKIPTLTDGDFTLWESNAIMQYLSEKYGNYALWGHDARTRADVSRWQFWEASAWLPALGILIYENMVKKFFRPGSPDPDAAEVKRGEERFHVVAHALDQHLKGRRFIVGNEVTLADFSVGGLLTYAGPARMPLESYSHIRSWFSGLDEIEAWKASGPPAPPPSAH